MTQNSPIRELKGKENSRTVQKKGVWTHARQLAEKTPSTRNRYVDFLRAVSILSVVLGHWIMAAPYYEHGKSHMWHLLSVLSWSQWLTWIFQVMPIFFFVGGFSNLTSWEASKRRGNGYASWLGSRLQRLLGPVLPLLGVWIILAVLGKKLGVPDGFIQTGSRIALVPTWFLAVYLLVVLFVPLTYSAWKRFGLWTVGFLVTGAALVDMAFFIAHWHLLGWINYLFVWLAIHQLGYAWCEGLFKSAPKTFLIFPIGFLTLLALVSWGPYPLSLVGVPSEAVSNTLPPKLPLLALGFAQIGLFLSLQGSARRWLNHVLPWTGTVFINGMIMTIFLWHSTAMVLVVGLGFWLIPSIFEIAPGSGGWWMVRPLWIFAFAIATLPFILIFSRFERASASKAQTPKSVWRLYLGCVFICSGLGYLALKGIGGGPHWVFDAAALTFPFIGATCAGFGFLNRK